MFSAQVRIHIPLVKTDVNRAMGTLQEIQPGWGWGGGGGEWRPGCGEGNGKLKNTDQGSSTLLSAEKLDYA